MLFSTKVVSASGNLMLNICDPELVDKTLHDGDTKIKINPNYYAERNVDEHEAKNLLTKCNSINMVGELMSLKSCLERIVVNVMYTN